MASEDIDTAVSAHGTRAGAYRLACIACILLAGMGTIVAYRCAQGVPALTTDGQHRVPLLDGAGPVPNVCIYVDIHGMSVDPYAKVEGPRAILLIWRTGRVVYSGDQVGGGPPYYSGQIAPGRLERALARLDSQGVFSMLHPYMHNYGVDSDYTVIDISADSQELQLRSWHELFELNPGLVSTSGGVEALEGRDRQAVLAEEPEDFRMFRRQWRAIRDELRKLIPDDGELLPDAELSYPVK